MSSRIEHRVGFLGIPICDNGKKAWPVAWNEENLERLKALGFNTIQLNVAWGCRPADEPLNLEDVVELPEELARQYPQPVELQCDPSPERRLQRRADLRQRIELCQKAGLRTIFHFGAPYNAHCRFGDGPPNCISDENVIRRYELLLDRFAAEFPGVDDILLYTYDQDAWLCSEFGPCPACLGKPLHKRLVPFLDRFAAAWRKHSPQGRLWWEPWELSAGQVLACVQEVGVKSFGMAIHCNVAEVQATLPVDRWFKNTAALARERGIPVIGEYFIGGPSEELEPLVFLSHPLVILRGLKAMAAVPGITGIKEYFGLAPDKDDPNLAMAGLFFSNPEIDEQQALSKLAEPYDVAGEMMQEFWKLTSTGMELFPWDTSWYIRQIGRSVPAHSMSAAMLRGQQCHTPSWFSTRHAIFMKCDDSQPDPWMIEDVELRCRFAAERWAKALEIGKEALESVPEARKRGLADNLGDLERIHRRAVAYACHLRETNLATCMRWARQQGQSVPGQLVRQLHEVFYLDLQNALGEHEQWPEMQQAIELLASDVDAFLENYFCVGADERSKGIFSVTSR